MWRYGILLFAGEMMAQTTTLTVVSAATYERGGGLPPGMIATAFSPVITETGGYSITVGESAAATVAVATGQASFVLPTGLVDGTATIALRRDGGTVATASVRIGRWHRGFSRRTHRGWAHRRGLRCPLPSAKSSRCVLAQRDHED